MALEQVHETEKAKWDEVARREYADAAALPPYEDLADYVRRNPALAGIDDWLGDLRGKRVLEYGCGLGKLSALLAMSGARVHAFDISKTSVEVTRRRAELNGLAVEATVAAGESLPYPDGAFEVVIGKAVLHHLDVERGPAELRRVLAVGGRAAFLEPMGMNPLLRLARSRLPYREKTPRGADVPLSYREISAWGEGFSQFRFREVQLLAMAERLFGWDPRFPALYRLDERLLRRFPRLRRHCRYVTLFMER